MTTRNQVKAYKLDRPGSISGLAIHDIDRPEPGPSEILVRIRATAINNRDLMVVNDQYPFPIRTGVIPLGDAAGEVEAVGARVRRFKVGDRVTPAIQLGWIGGPARPEYFGTDLGASLDGVLQQYVVIPEEAGVSLPDHLSFEEGASLNIAGVTAWTSLNSPFPVSASDTVLTQGTGGVAIFALQLAKAMGARVIATTSSAEKEQLLRSLGADDVINYVTTPDWDRAVLALTGGNGVDRVIETGGPNTLVRSINSVRIGGQISLIGFSGGTEGMIDPLALIGRAIRIEAPAVGSRIDYEDMNRVIAAHRIKPVIDRVFSFAEAPAAFEHLQRKAHIGKIIITVE